MSAVADKKGVPPEQLDPRLGEVVDPDSLTTVFKNTSGYVTFDYDGYTVTVGDDGTVDVERYR
ncbi:HalOD1 output domain-containing protein [Halobaculum gomorrense]|uniref:HalOD1 output domain-containing protein n=1 Tax=Halobaculum gomorrense TaxID=43928 RepID=UPI00190EE015